MVGTVVKFKVGELEEEVREGFFRRIRKLLTGVVQGVSGKKRFLVRFHDGCKNYMTLNPLIVMIIEKSAVDEEPEVTPISGIPDETVPL